MTNARATLVVTLAATLQFGCYVGDDIVVYTTERPTFEEFEATTYLEPWDGGVYIVNGDTPIVNVKQLREFYDAFYSDGALAVHRSGGADAKWNSSMQHNLTYCVSNSFGARKSTVVAAMAEATASWEQAADLDFVYDASQDANCTASNSAVVFDVRPTSGASYLARAFFPNQTRSSRNVIIDSSAFGSSWPLTGVLAHELGHALGFRHEHTRPEAGQCYEDDNWRPLTPYDSASVMHYPHCGGTGVALTMSDSDRAGAAALYGAPSGDGTGGGGTDGGGTDGGGTDGGGTDGGGTTRTGSASGSLANGQNHYYEPLDVVPGTRFDVQISGSGDADLYVRFGAQPNTFEYDCRPYLNGSNETCSIDVPAGQTQAFMMVHGYTAASYDLYVAWVAP